MKFPVPELSVVLVLNAIVGTELVLHTTPLDKIGNPPSLLIFPPVIALVAVIELTAVVVKIGNVLAGVGNDVLAGGVIVSAFLQEAMPAIRKITVTK